MNKRKILNIINKFKNKKIGVIGDLMLDQFIWGTAERISPEAPIPIVIAEEETFVPGGAGNTANNIASLGGKVVIVGMIGADIAGKQLVQELRKKEIDITGVMRDKSRPTTQKIRIVAQGQQMVRTDKEKNHFINAEETSRVLDFISSRIKRWDGLVVSNYVKGLFTKDLAQEIINLTQKYNKFLIVDTKPEQVDYFRNFTLITPNFKEAEEISKKKDLKEMGREIQKQLNCNVLITQGAEGMTLFENNKIKHLPTEAEEVFDVSGAGDTVVATFALALASGANLWEAAYIANHAAGVVVGKIGTATISLKELKRKLETLNYETR